MTRKIKNISKKVTSLSDEQLEILEQKRTKASKFFKKVLPIVMLVAILFVVSFIWAFFTSGNSVVSYVLTAASPIKSTNDRINILLLGNGGGKHDGPYLTDSIIVASYNQKTKNVVMFSIPRDLWLESTNSKINAIYEEGMDEGNNPLQFAKDRIGDLVGLPIHYGIRVDFTGFAKAIDLVGGIVVNVPREFDDYNYPIEEKRNDPCLLHEEERELDATIAGLLKKNPGKHRVWVRPDGNVATAAADFACRFEHLRFEAGETIMDGSTALKFVRSRQGTNGEGSDFARSRRQQLVIEAFRQKALSLPTLTNPAKISELINTFNKSFEFDIPLKHYLEFYQLVKEVNHTDTVVLGDLGNGQSIFENPPLQNYGGAWVLIPKDGDYEQVAIFVEQVLTEKQ